MQYKNDLKHMITMAKDDYMGIVKAVLLIILALLLLSLISKIANFVFGGLVAEVLIIIILILVIIWLLGKEGQRFVRKVIE